MMPEDAVPPDPTLTLKACVEVPATTRGLVPKPLPIVGAVVFSMMVLNRFM